VDEDVGDAVAPAAEVADGITWVALAVGVEVGTGVSVGGGLVGCEPPLPPFPDDFSVAVGFGVFVGLRVGFGVFVGFGVADGTVCRFGFCPGAAQSSGLIIIATISVPKRSIQNPCLCLLLSMLLTATS
jgi:hypothetical protein